MPFLPKPVHVGVIAGDAAVDGTRRQLSRDRLSAACRATIRRRQRRCEEPASHVGGPLRSGASRRARGTVPARRPHGRRLEI
jgi:hypothetical protein